MRNVRFGIITVLLVSLGGAGSTLAVSGLRFKTGVGYEYMSQKFYLDSLELSGADSVSVSNALNTTYLNDLKGHISLDYIPYDDYRLELRSVYEQTPDQFRWRINTDYRSKLGKFKLDWSSELDWRDGKIKPDEEDEGYLSGYGRAKLTWPVSQSVSIWGRAKGDFVKFDQARDGAYNYHRLGGQFGILKYFSNFSSVGVSVFSEGRSVTSAESQDYFSYGLELAFSGFYSKGDIDLFIRYETRDYDRVAELGDYRWFELNGRHRHNLGQLMFMREELKLETIRFDSTDLYTAAYLRLEGAVMVGVTRDGWSLAVGPEAEILREDQAEDYLVSQDYSELGLKSGIDYMKIGKLFGSVESVLGKRNIADAAKSVDLYSNFIYERLSLLVDWNLAGGFSLNVLVSADWEWHDKADENSRLALVNCGLYYSF